MLRIVASIGLALGVAAIGGAVYCWWPTEPPATATDQAAVKIDDVDVGELPLEQSTPIQITVRNDSPAPIRVIGGPWGCQPGACMNTRGPCPVTIPANAVETVTVDVTATRLGELHLNATLYLEINHVAVERTIKLHGLGIAHEGPPTFGKP